MPVLAVSDEWRKSFPSASAGILILAEIQEVVLRVSPGGVTRGLEVHVNGATA